MTLFSVMRRPRWIAALVLALAIAAIFAGLGQWQLERAVSSGQVDDRPTETVKPLSEVASPQQPVLAVEAAQKVQTRGILEPADYSILADRLNGDRPGYWVIAHLSVDEPGTPALAVALGWAPDRESAVAVRDRLAAQPRASDPVAVEGRYIDPDAPNIDDAQKAKGGDYDITTMSPAALVNIWTALTDSTDVYGGYVISSAAPDGLDLIAAPEPDRSVELNWLNIFYAVEWVIFAGFAVFLWYRLARDAWEREMEELEEAERDLDDRSLVEHGIH
ncbi:SURF1 family cytochrome oxidase biogenesis protein [Agreia bicolorata]|nr:SURF1 family cytochrome oxidase biogenesis protein [Agreia bicolorata]